MKVMVKPRAAKPWYCSRTLWLNAIAVALLAAEAQIGLLQTVLPGNVYAWAAFVLPIVNALIRMRHLDMAMTPPPAAAPVKDGEA